VHTFLGLQNRVKTISESDLLVVRDFFDAKTCRALIEEMRHSPASAALTYGKGEGIVDERVRRVRQVSMSSESTRFVIGRLEDHRENLERHFDIKLGACEPPQFLCYRVGDFFVAHQDGNTGLIDLDTDRARRISVTIFLNEQSTDQDGDTYCGGSLVFSDWRTGARREVYGENGMLVAFRSEMTHEVTLVTYGERYAIVSWYRRRPTGSD
jgi:SM-20-related protein